MPKKTQIGAQIWVEPCTTPAQINEWMHILRDQAMPLARIWIIWNHVEQRPDTWDFSLYDVAFDSASKYGIGVLATLTPGNLPVHRGGLPLIHNDRTIPVEIHLEAAREYVRRVVEHYKAHPALDTWILMNEPGMRPRVDELSNGHFPRWLKTRYTCIEALNAAWHTLYRDFEEAVFDGNLMVQPWSHPAGFIDWYEFWRVHQAEQLSLWADIIRAQDQMHGLHVNPHGLIGNMAALSNDLPVWRKFLNSLGTSIHPAWHFWMLKPERYALGVSYVCELVRGAGEPLPFWVTELQGGNNIYTTPRPMCPTPEDIAQWTWISAGAGAERIIFWLLNPRPHSQEAGEWAMLDFQNSPTDRLITAGEIAGVINRHGDFFAGSHPVESPVSIILSLETMTLQERFGANDSAGRGSMAHIFEALGIYEALQETGVPARIKHLHDFPWREKTPSPQLAILPNVSSITRRQAEDIRTFVENGNTILATGLTGLYDERSNIWPLKDSPLPPVFGGNFKEIRHVGDNTLIDLQESGITLPAHLFITDIDHHSGDILAQKEGRIFAVRNEFKKGEAVWIPALIGLGALLGDRKPLASFLAGIATRFTKKLPFIFGAHCPGVIMRVLQNGKSFVTVVANGSDAPAECNVLSRVNLKPELLWGKSTSFSADGFLTLNKRETVVLFWK